MARLTYKPQLFVFAEAFTNLHCHRGSGKTSDSEAMVQVLNERGTDFLLLLMDGAKRGLMLKKTQSVIYLTIIFDSHA